MKYKPIKGKKGVGFTGQAVSNFWSYVVFIFVVIVFYVFFQLSGCSIKDNKMIDLKNQQYEDIALISCLRTPVDPYPSKYVTVGEIPQGQERTVADLLVESYLKEEKGFYSYQEFYFFANRCFSDVTNDWGLTIDTYDTADYYTIEGGSYHASTARREQSLVGLMIPKGKNDFEIIGIMLEIGPINKNIPFP